MTVLETQRLTFRPYEEADFDAMAALHCTPSVMAHMRGGAVDRHAARRAFDSYLYHWRDSDISIWALRRKDDGAFIGECGFWVRADFPGRSMRYILAEPYWGRGYALEAAMAAVQWGFEFKRVPRITAVAQQANPASVRILERLGLILEDTAHNGLVGFHRYAVDRDDWLAERARP